jgi:tellurite resistance protein TehA-like permease
MLREKKIKVGNMLPAIFIPLVWFVVQRLTGIA